MMDSGGRTWRQARSPITFSDSQIDYRLAPTPIEDAVTLDVLLRELA
jgi:hypothetical protein